MERCELHEFTGILYWSTFNKHSLLSEYIKNDLFEYGGTNPCLVGDTLISTIHGEIPIKDLVGQQPYVYCVDENGKLDIRQASKVWLTRKDAELVEVDFYRGKIVCTPDHLIYTMNRGWVKAIDLQPKDKLNGLGISSHQYKVLRLTSQGAIGKEHRFIASKMYGDLKGMDVHHIDGNKSNNDWDNLEVLPHGHHSVITNEGHEPFVGRDELGRFKKGEGKGKKDYEPLKYNEDVKGKNFIVKKVTKLDYVEDVYDMTVPGVHNFIANHIEVHNCAEEPLPEGGACLLGSINLSEYVKYPFTNYAEFDFANFEKDIPLYVTALNDCLEENQDLHPLDYQRECAKEWKQIGLGIMGLADVFIKMGIQYGSQESLDLIDEIGHVLAYVSLLTSSQLNIEKGEAPFSKGGHNLLADSWFVNNHSNEDMDGNALKDRIRKFGLYNSALLTVAPTGSISTMLGTSGGIEPIFATSYNRRTISLNDEETTYKVYTPVIQQLMDALDINNEEDLPSYVITSHEIKPLNRIKVQSTMQEHIDASISSTINLKEDATFDDVYEIYMQAWEYGLKGVTIYRDNCKRQGILTTEPKKEDNSAEVEANNSDNAIPRGYILPTNDDVIGLKRKIVGGCGSLHLQVYFDYNTGNMTEVFINKGGSGGCNSNLNALSRMISLALRGGISIEDIVDQLSSTINCPSFASARAKGIQLSPGSSCANAVGRTLLELDKEFKEMFTKVLKEENDTNANVDDDKIQEYLAYIEKHGQIEFVKTYHKCPDCFDDIMASGGCYQCNSCGFSKCE